MTRSHRLFLVSRLASTGALGLALLVVVSGAQGARPKVTAGVETISRSTRAVHIVNHDTVTYRNFVAVTLAKPRIIAASKPCVVGRDGRASGTGFVWLYRADCRKAVAPGKAFDIRLTTSSERGPVYVYVVVNGTRILIS